MNNEDDIIQQIFTVAFLNNINSKPKPTAWKLDDVEFIREGQNVNIFGMGELHIPITTLKTILETLETN